MLGIFPNRRIVCVCVCVVAGDNVPPLPVVARYDKRTNPFLSYSRNIFTLFFLARNRRGNSTQNSRQNFDRDRVCNKALVFFPLLMCFTVKVFRTSFPTRSHLSLSICFIYRIFFSFVLHVHYWKIAFLRKSADRIYSFSIFMGWNVYRV